MRPSMVSTFDLWRGTVLLAFTAAMVRGSAWPGEVGVVLQALQFGGLVLAIALLRTPSRERGKIANLPNVGLLVLAGLALASTAWSVSPERTLVRAGLFAVITAFVVTAVSWRWNDSDIAWRDCEWIAGAIVAFSAAGLALGLVGVVPLWAEFHRFEGLSANANVAGWLAGLGLLTMYGGWLAGRTSSRFWRAFSIGFLWIVVVLTGTRGAMLAVMLGLLVLHIAARRSWLTGVALLAATALALLFPIASYLPDLASNLPDGVTGPASDRSAELATDYSSGRLGLWRAALSLVEARPWLGTGYGTVSLLPGYAESSSGMTPHNSYLTALVELGIVGGVLLACLVVCLVVLSLRPPRIMLAGAAAAAAFSGLMESALFSVGSPLTMFAWVLLSVPAAGWVAARRKSRAGSSADTRASTI